RDRCQRQCGAASEHGRACPRPHDGAADLHRGDPCWRQRRSARARPRRQARSPVGARAAGMTATTGSPSTFKVGLIQLRSGLAPAANIDMASKLIGEAKRAGADYVLTPEMTNVMEIRRERLFANLVEEEQDASLATFRELARLGGVYLHIG